jgi:hypothetical protein
MKSARRRDDITNGDGKMPHPIRVIVTAIVLGLVLVSQSGCLLLVAAAGTGTGVAYYVGDLDVTLEAPPARVVKATEKAMKDLDLAVIVRESSGMDGKVIGRTARDVKMTVVVKGHTDKVSNVSVRAGMFGDDGMQARLLDKIRENLKTADPAVAAAGPTTSPADPATRPSDVASVQ